MVEAIVFLRLTLTLPMKIYKGNEILSLFQEFSEFLSFTGLSIHVGQAP